MSKSASKTLIGLFVVGALTLLCVAIAVFGSGRLFKDSIKMVLIFDSSISGLSMGSPVVFRGVPVGRVVSIELEGNIDLMNFRTAVFIELGQEIADDLLQRSPEDGVKSSAPFEFDTQNYVKLIQHGLRARLAPQSLLTGQLMVELDFYPATEAGPAVNEITFVDETPEIPTIPSRFDSLLHKLTEMPFERIGKNVLQITDSLADLASKANRQDVSSKLAVFVDEARGFIQAARPAVDELRLLATTTRQTMRSSGGQLDQALLSARETMQRLDGAALEASKTLASVRTLAGPESVTLLEFNRALREVSEAARALRSLASLLERNPEALLRGKGDSGSW